MGPPTQAPLPALHTSLAARRANQVNAKLTEIDGRLANLRAAAGREHDAGTNSFDAAAQAAERDCAWADRALKTMEGDANQASGSRRGHERAMAQCLRSKLSERLEALQEAMKARQRALKVQHKRRTKFSHAGPAISTRVQLDTPLFSTAFVPKHAVVEPPKQAPKPKPPPPPMTDPFAMSSAFSTQTACVRDGLNRWRRRRAWKGSSSNSGSSWCSSRTRGSGWTMRWTSKKRSENWARCFLGLLV